MAPPPASPTSRPTLRQLIVSRHHLELLGRYLAWQTLLYFTPLLLLAVFFNLQYERGVREGQRVHLETVAEYEARTLDVFFRERVVDLSHLVNSPQFLQQSRSGPFLQQELSRLRASCDAFVDLGVVSASGTLESYVGPVRYPKSVSYREEGWFGQVMKSDEAFVITDSYLGLRGQPHFTIAARRTLDSEALVLRAALSPERIQRYLSSLEGADDASSALVNRAGVYQVVPPRVGEPLEEAPFVPPADRRRGFGDAVPGGIPYAFAHLSETPWTLVVPRDLEASANGPGASRRGSMRGSILAFTLLFFALAGLVSLVRAWQMARRDLDVEQHEAEMEGQLVHAAKLASVGELAAGVAHEINNPLAIIAAEVGLIQDEQDPELADDDDDEPFVLDEHLQTIHDAVFRCRDITRKLLTFVRQTEIKLERHDMHEILDEVLEALLGNEISLANVHLVRDYCTEANSLVTDKNQVVQVFVNLVKNAIDAMGDGGTLTVRTAHEPAALVVWVSDTGCGMTQEQLARAFQPFFTTKEPGRGTGLGLSVSHGIVANLGGKVEVESAPGKGTTFRIELPYELAS